MGKPFPIATIEASVATPAENGFKNCLVGSAQFQSVKSMLTSPPAHYSRLASNAYHLDLQMGNDVNKFE